jgi:predicted PurR-regulated permease PerM
MAQHVQPGDDATAIGDQVFRALRRAVVFALAAIVLLRFLHTALAAVMVGAVVVIMAMALNVPVTWLARRMPRAVATLLVELLVLGAIVGLAWLVVPEVVAQAKEVGSQLPDHLDRLRSYVDDLAKDYPIVERISSGLGDSASPDAGQLVARVGTLAVSAGTGLLLVIVVVSLVTYAVIDPRPLLQGYLKLFPSRMQDDASLAFARASQMVVAWLWSNVIVGGVEGVAAFIVLHLLGVPGATLWAVLTFFAELVPKLGPYIMAAPPALVAFADSPTKGLAVVVFYVILVNFTGHVIDPPVRGKVMHLHPVVLLFAVVVFGVGLGFMGALLATPLTGIGAAYVEVFYLAHRHDDDSHISALVERMLERDSTPV